MDQVARRERQARRLLRVCLRPLNTECVQRYVRAYEGGRLKHGDGALCAIGTMSGDRYHEWTIRGYGIGGRSSAHVRRALHIESVFEGWMIFMGTRLESWSSGRGFHWHAVAAARRTWIYEACVEELARRASLATPAYVARESALK